MAQELKIDDYSIFRSSIKAKDPIMSFYKFILKSKFKFWEQLYGEIQILPIDITKIRTNSKTWDKIEDIEFTYLNKILRYSKVRTKEMLHHIYFQYGPVIDNKVKTDVVVLDAGFVDFTLLNKRR